eukprot:scaffold72665_cov21-Cyclotella_meneghiniana.AAC.1
MLGASATFTSYSRADPVLITKLEQIQYYLPGGVAMFSLFFESRYMFPKMLLLAIIWSPLDVKDGG